MLLNRTPDGILVKPGQIWSYRDANCKNVKIKILSINAGKITCVDAVTGVPKQRPISIRTMTPPGKMGKAFQLISK